MTSTPLSLAIVLMCIVVSVAAAETPAPNAATAAAAPAAERAVKTLLPAAGGAWLLLLDSKGGRAGHGMGGVTIVSDGKVFAHRLGRRINEKCGTRLTNVKLQAFTRAVSAAEPSAWSALYEPAEDKACCDLFTWSLRLHHREADGAERVTHTGWHDMSEGRPKDLLALETLAQSAMRTVPANCEP